MNELFLAILDGNRSPVVFSDGPESVSHLADIVRRVSSISQPSDKEVWSSSI